MLILSIVSVCGVDVVSIYFAMELFRETLERKVCKGKNNNEKKKQKTRGTRHYSTITHTSDLLAALLLEFNTCLSELFLSTQRLRAFTDKLLWVEYKAVD